MKSVCPMFLDYTKTRSIRVKPFQFHSVELQLTKLAFMKLPFNPNTVKHQKLLTHNTLDSPKHSPHQLLYMNPIQTPNTPLERT
jgi:hypothetical protein